MRMMLVQQRLSLPLYLAGSRHMRILGVLQRDLLMLECGRSILGLIQLRIILLCSSWQMLKTLTWRFSALLKLLSPCYLWIIFRATWEISAPLLIMPRPATAFDLGVRVTPFIHLQHIMSWFESNICSTIYLPKTFLSVDKNLLFLSGLVLRSIFSLRAWCTTGTRVLLELCRPQ